MPADTAATIDPAMAAQNAIPLTGIIVLMLIPVVAYALWGDYFERYVARMREEHQKLETTEELYRVRLNGLFAILAEAVVYLGGTPNRQEHPYICGALAFATIGTLLLLQSKFERHIRDEERKTSQVASTSGATETAKGETTSAIRAFVWSLLAGMVYLVVFACSVVLCTLPAAVMKVPGTVAVLMLICGIASGVMGGLCASFALAPLFVRKIFGAEPITNDSIVRDLDRIFDEAGVGRPGYFTIQPKQHHAAGAMVAGFRSGRGLFRPALFISASALESLTLGEMRSVVLHEVSHIRLRHLRKRFVFSSGLVICASLSTGTLVQVVQVALKRPELGGLVGCIALVGAFAFALRALAQQSRFQEVQADIHSIDQLGSSLDDLASALRKLDRMNGALPFRKEPGAMMLASGHPETELRIRILKKYFERKKAQEESGGDSGERAA